MLSLYLFPTPFTSFTTKCTHTHQHNNIPVLWKRNNNNKRPFEKIKRNVLSLDIEEGGMKMISIENQHKMFLSKWTAKLLGDKKTVCSQIAKHCFTPFVSMHRALITTVDSKHNQARNKIDSHCWREAIKATTLMNRNR